MFGQESRSARGAPTALPLVVFGMALRFGAHCVSIMSSLEGVGGHVCEEPVWAHSKGMPL